MLIFETCSGKVVDNVVVIVVKHHGNVEINVNTKAKITNSRMRCVFGIVELPSTMFPLNDKA